MKHHELMIEMLWNTTLYAMAATIVTMFREPAAAIMGRLTLSLEVKLDPPARPPARERQTVTRGRRAAPTISRQRWRSARQGR